MENDFLDTTTNNNDLTNNNSVTFSSTVPTLTDECGGTETPTTTVETVDMSETNNYLIILVDFIIILVGVAVFDLLRRLFSKV